MEEKFKKDLKMFNCFKSFNLEDNKEKRESFHETIKENNDQILDCYSQQYFKEILPNILKANRSNSFYSRLVKKGFKHKSPFFKILLKAIKEINEKKYKIEIPYKEKLLNIYRKPEIELLKIKKEKIEKNTQKKLKNIKIEKEKLHKYTRLINEQLASISDLNINQVKTPKILSPLSTVNLNSTNNSFKINNNFNFTKNIDISPSNKEGSTYYKSRIKFKSLTRNNSLNSFNLKPSPIIDKSSISYIYDKCKEEIDHGKKVAENVFKYNEKISKSIEKKLGKRKNSTDRLKKIIEGDKSKNKNKYAKLEENNIKLIKKKLNEKISDFYAYQNRKEFQEILKNNENTQAYNIYLDEMNRINEKMGKRSVIERKRIEKIESLCDDGFKRKEYLKNRIDIFNKRHKEEKKQKNIILNDDFYIMNKNNEKDQIGSLLPKILSLRNNCLHEITVGNFFIKK